MSLHISEYMTTVKGTAIPFEPALAHQEVEPGGVSKPFGSQTTIVGLYADEDCDVDFGSGPLRIRSGERVQVGVTPGWNAKVTAAPRNSGSDFASFLRVIADPKASAERLEQLAKTESRVAAKQKDFEKQAAEVAKAAVEVAARETALKTHLAELKAHEEELAAKVSEFEAHAETIEAEYAKREAILTKGEKVVSDGRAAFSSHVAERQAEHDAKERELASRDAEIKMREASVIARETAAAERERDMTMRMKRMKELAE